MKPLISNKKQTLKRRLVAYMCVLALLLCALLLAGMFLIGNFTGTKKRIRETLDFQGELFERQIERYFDSLAVMSVQLSSDVTDILEAYLADNSLCLADLNGSGEHIEELQESLIEPLKHKLWEADCTGAFVMLDARVNMSGASSSSSRTGIYLQRNSLEMADTRVLLYRGLAKTGKDHNCMPHRKWRLEFNTELFPNYAQLKAEADLPLDRSYRITDVVRLPGTDQHVMLMTIPLISDDGTYYGLCGFELNEGFFKQTFAQPSELDHAVFCISKSSEGLDLSESNSLFAGIVNEYYLEPRDSFIASSFGGGLIEYKGETEAYVGISREIGLCPSGCSSAISVLIPKEDYRGLLYTDILRVILLIIAFAIAAGGLSTFFARRFLKPIKTALNSIQKKEYPQDLAHSAEISDLFVFLAEQDRINEEELCKLRREKTDAVTAAHELQSKYDETAKQNERLAYSRKYEIAPDDYENFKNGLKSLTSKEKEVFDLYLHGRTVRQIMETLGLQESTVRFHNKNIYAKLGVHSLKQLLLYATVMQNEDEPQSQSDGEAQA